MRIQSTGEQEYRKRLIERVQEACGESTKSKAFDVACRHYLEDLRAKGNALDHPDMTPELAEILTTRHVTCEYEVKTEVKTGD